MLAKPFRLRKAADIAHVYKKGTYGGSSVVISVKALVSGRGTPRVVVVVSKKVSKQAVVRNRLRRRVLGDLERHWQTVRPGYDIVVSVHSDVSILPAEKLHDHLFQALARTGASFT